MAPDGRHESDINKKKVCTEQIEIFAGLCSLQVLKSDFSKKKKQETQTFNLLILLSHKLKRIAV